MIRKTSAVTGVLGKAGAIGVVIFIVVVIGISIYVSVRRKSEKR